MVWVIHQYASTPKEGMGGRWFYLARELVKKGWKVNVFCSSTHHLLRSEKLLDSSEGYLVENVEGINFIWIKTTSYSHPHSIRRVMGWFEFAYKVIKYSKKIKDIPDSVLVSSPSLFAYLSAEYLAKKFSAKLLFDVRDIWPLTLVELGGIKKTHPLVLLMSYLESRAYKKSDIVISNLKGANEHFVSRGCDAAKIRFVPNGFCERELKIETKQEHKMSIPSNKFVVGYLGTHGLANCLDVLLGAAKDLSIINNEIHFVLVGEGKEKDNLIKAAEAEGLSNITFLDSVPKQIVYSMIKCFDVCYIGSKPNSLYRFGIGANKIPEYMSAGKPIIHSYSGRFDPIKLAECGHSFDSGHASDLVACIMSIYKMTEAERREMGMNGQIYARNNLQYSVLADEVEELLIR